MEKHEAAIAMSKKTPVAFGRERGATAIGEIIKCNPSKAKVRLTAQYNSHGPGTVFVVPYSMLQLADESARPSSPSFPTPEPLTFNVFTSGADIHILLAINCVYGDLSPENLTCDGELSRTEVNRRYSALQRKLKGLFAALGREVDEGEAYKWEQEYNKRQAERRA